MKGFGGGGGGRGRGSNRPDDSEEEIQYTGWVTSGRTGERRNSCQREGAAQQGELNDCEFVLISFYGCPLWQAVLYMSLSFGCDL